MLKIDLCRHIVNIVLILSKFKIKDSIGMQYWKPKQTILIYIIILKLFDKQNAKFNIHLLCPNKQ